MSSTVTGILILVFTIQGDSGLEIKASYRGMFPAEKCWEMRDKFLTEPMEPTFNGRLVLSQTPVCVQQATFMIQKDAEKL